MKKVVFFGFLLMAIPILLQAQDSLYDAFKKAETYNEVIAATTYNDGELLQRLDTSDLKRYRRFRSFWDHRVDSLGNMWPYTQAWMNLFLGEERMQTRTMSAMNWKHLGPFEMASPDQNYMGRFQSVAVDPENPEIVYAGSITGGLWKTVNADASPATSVEWTCLTNNFPSLGAMDVIVHPTSTNIVYFIGSFYQTNVANVRYYSVGIFKSTDSGNSWTCVMQLDPENEIMLTRLEFDPINPGYVFALANDRLYKSDFGGDSFDLLYIFTNPVPNQLWEIAISSSNHNNIMVGGRKNDLYYSTNGGTTFSLIYNSSVFTSSVTPPEYFETVNMVPCYNPFDGNFGVISNIMGVEITLEEMAEYPLPVMGITGQHPTQTICYL